MAAVGPHPLHDDRRDRRTGRRAASCASSPTPATPATTARAGRRGDSNCGRMPPRSSVSMPDARTSPSSSPTSAATTSSATHRRPRRRARLRARAARGDRRGDRRCARRRWAGPLRRRRRLHRRAGAGRRRGSVSAAPDDVLDADEPRFRELFSRVGADRPRRERRLARRGRRGRVGCRGRLPRLRVAARGRRVSARASWSTDDCCAARTAAPARWSSSTTSPPSGGAWGLGFRAAEWAREAIESGDVGPGLRSAQRAARAAGRTGGASPSRVEEMRTPGASSIASALALATIVGIFGSLFDVSLVVVSGAISGGSRCRSRRARAATPVAPGSAGAAGSWRRHSALTSSRSAPSPALATSRAPTSPLSPESRRPRAEPARAQRDGCRDRIARPRHPCRS